MKANNNFVVHVYSFSTVTEKLFSIQKDAVEYANDSFCNSTVYKVKVWDITKGKIEPNRPNARALVMELV